MKLSNTECIYYVLNGSEDKFTLHSMVENAPKDTDVFFLCTDETKPDMYVPACVIICKTDNDIEQMKVRLKDAYWGLM